jgi:hypothetical protein
MATSKNAVLLAYWSEVTAPKLEGAEVVTFSAWIEFAAAIVDEYGTATRGVADKLADVLYNACDSDGEPIAPPTMTRPSFVNRVNEAIRLVVKFGSVKDLGAAVEAFNDQREDDGKAAIYSVQRLAGFLAPSDKVAKVAKADADTAPMWSPDDFTTGKVRQALISAGLPMPAIGAVLDLLAKGVKV